MSTNSTIAALWSRRSLIRELTRSNLKQTHRNTALGYFWWLLDPILMTAVYTILVTFIRQRPDPSYPAFVMCGLVAWKSFSTNVGQSLTAMSRSEGLIKAFSFPKAVLPLSIVLSNLVLFAFSLLPLMALCLVYEHVMGVTGIHVGAVVLLTPLVIVVQLTIDMGMSLMFSSFGVLFRDLAPLMTHVLRMAWYLSPGLYPIKAVVKDYRGLAHVDWTNVRSLYLLNPFAHLLESYRNVILYGRMPDWLGLAYALAFGVVVAVVGFRVFRNRERFFAKWV